MSVRDSLIHKGYAKRLTDSRNHRFQNNGDGRGLPLDSDRPLTSLRAGELGVLCEVKTEARTAKRLADLGFIGGARVEMIRPGRPCVVRINGTRVGLGRSLQERILVLSDPVGVDGSPGDVTLGRSLPVLSVEEPEPRSDATR